MNHMAGRDLMAPLDNGFCSPFAICFLGLKVKSFAVRRMPKCDRDNR